MDQQQLDLDKIKLTLRYYQGIPKNEENTGLMSDYALKLIPELVEEIERLRAEIAELNRLQGVGY